MKTVYRNPLVLSIALGLALFLSAFQADAAPAKAGKANAFTAHEPMNLDGYLNVIVESSVGSPMPNAKTKYLPTPFNMGIVPKTSVDKNNAAPLPVILLGDAAAPGSVQKAFAIGVLEGEEGGAAKKILIAGNQKSSFGRLNSIEQLDVEFPGVKEIIQTWFANANGKNSITVNSIKSRPDAIGLAGDSILNYYNATITEADRRPLDKDGNPTTLDHPKSKNIRFEYGG